MNMDFGIQIKDETQQQSQSKINQDDRDDQLQTKSQNLGACGFLTVAYYQPYFNVTQEDVTARLKSSMLPIKQDFLEIVQGNPDLWGPIWISTSLVLLVAAAGNLMKYLNSETVSYDFSFVPVAAALLYSVAFGTPVLLTVLMKCFGSDLSLFSTICLYGYSMAILVPITILCILPYSLIHWVLIIGGFLLSCFFLIVNLQIELAKIEQQKKYIVFGVIVGMQLILYLMFKFYFFGIIQDSEAVKPKKI